MGFWGWASAIAAGWLVASFVVAAGWWLVGRRIFRKPPVPPTQTITIVANDNAGEVLREVAKKAQQRWGGGS